MAGSQIEKHPRCPRIGGVPTPLLRKAQEVEASVFNPVAKRSMKRTGGWVIPVTAGHGNSEGPIADQDQLRNASLTRPPDRKLVAQTHEGPRPRPGALRLPAGRPALPEQSASQSQSQPPLEDDGLRYASTTSPRHRRRHRAEAHRHDSRNRRQPRATDHPGPCQDSQGGRSGPACREQHPRTCADSAPVPFRPGSLGIGQPRRDHRPGGRLGLEAPASPSARLADVQVPARTAAAAALQQPGPHHESSSRDCRAPTLSRSSWTSRSRMPSRSP